MGGDNRTLKLGSGTTSGHGLYVNPLLGVPWRAAGVKAFQLLSVAALAAGLSLGCAGPSLQRRYDAGKQSWEQTAGGASLTSDGAELFESSPYLDREVLIRAVLRRNPSIRSAHYAWKAAFERFPQETALDDPTAGLGVVPTSFGSSRVNDAYKIELSQKLPFPGKLSLRGEIALAEAEAARNDFEALQLRLATVASLLYDELYLVRRSLEINAQHIALLEEFLQISTIRYEAGKSAQQDPLQAEVELTHAVHREVVLETEQRIAIEQINLLLHRHLDVPLPRVSPELALPPAAEADPENLMALALHGRPELRAAEARVQGRASAVALALREYFPDLTLVGAYNTLWQEEDLQPFVGLRFDVPLQATRRRAAVEEAKARLKSAQSEYTSLEDEVRFSVQSSLHRLREAQHVMQLFGNRLLPASRDQVEAALAGYETGRNSFLTLIVAERNLRDTELGYEAARTNVSRRYAELQRAIGRTPGLAQDGEQ
ncbi:MAG TPA: TolC family protein [Myxococcales bacterium]|nr:TolC family protein [Myxococcales bacterium]